MVTAHLPPCIADRGRALFSCRESRKTCSSSTRVFAEEGRCSESTSACLCTVTTRRPPRTPCPSQCHSLARLPHPRVFAADPLTPVVCCCCWGHMTTSWQVRVDARGPVAVAVCNVETSCWEKIALLGKCDTESQAVPKKMGI